MTVPWATRRHDPVAEAQSFLDQAQHGTDQAASQADGLRAGLDRLIGLAHPLTMRTLTSDVPVVELVELTVQYRVAAQDLVAQVVAARAATTRAAACLVSIDITDPAFRDVSPTVGELSVAVIGLDAVLGFAEPVVSRIREALDAAEYAPHTQDSDQVVDTMRTLGQCARDLAAISRLLDASVPVRHAVITHRVGTIVSFLPRSADA